MNSSSIIESLKSKGHKNTKIRQALVEILLSIHSPLSITELLQNLSKKGLKPNKTTVYREISLLKDLDTVQEVDFGDGKKMYEISEDHHHHIRCVQCNLIKDVPMDRELNDQERKILKNLGFKPVGHSLEFFGLCESCQ